MSDDRIVITSGTAVSPEIVASRTFATSFRGYDQAEVRMFLKRVSEELVATADREAELRRALHEALNRAAHPELDEEVLTNVLGEQTARLLTNARETAAAIVSDAETRASRTLQEGEGRIARMRAEAETLLSRRAEEAEHLANGLRQAAESDARTLRERARADAQAEIEAARAQGREMVAEAKELRERMLTDLLRRRRIGEGQIEQLRVARQRLVDAFHVVRRTLDEASHELAAADVDTRPVMDAALARPEAQGQVASASEAQVERHAPSMAEELAPTPHERLVGVEAAEPEPDQREPHQREPGQPEADQPVADQPVGAPAMGRQAEPSPRPPDPGPASLTEELDRAPSPEPPVHAEEASPAERPEREAPVDDPAGMAALGAGTAFASGPTPRDNRGGNGRSTSLPPVDIAAPGEEVRIVREVDAEARLASSDAAVVSAVPPDQPAPSTDPAAIGERARTRGRDHKGRPASAQVEELFARLRAAQLRRDAEPDRSASPGSTEQTTAAVGAAPEDVDATAPDDAPAAAAPVGDGASVEARPHVDDEKALYRRDELLDPIDSDLARRLKRVLQDEQNEVLDRLRRQRRPVAETTLPELMTQTERYQSVAVPLLRRAASTGAAFVSGRDAPGPPPDGTSDASVEGWAAELAVDLIVPLRERLERLLHEAVDDEGDATVTERLSASYRQWKLQRVEQVARHYSSAAFSQGAFAAAADGAVLRWVVDDDGPCPDCEDNALAGPTPKGQAFPTGQMHPPAHRGCRCLLISTDL